ncbi:hypothetical protein S7335_2531 [Synechococcus sp. PCC 7335]|uniref:hypothetical protein n=1 Tax=Synechococcus sp. (strain ATCC 29403 / PCC 7335) TaxID=91464 RepID=UPI00017EB471|nr:hypothetical protein [Synechococcus sp. PCC 7335]EDX84834.1 hypothetical protein S7335_2531 [Synechococcus sp. PCC 7335]
MFNRYSLGATVLGIFSLAVFGIVRAFTWLSESPNPEPFVDRGEFVEVDANERSRNEITKNTDDQFIEDTRVRDGRNDDLALTFADDQPTSPSDQTNSSSEDDVSSDRFLKDVLDPTLLDTDDAALTEATSTQSDIQNDQLVPSDLSNASPVSTDAESTNAENIEPTAPAPQSVPALW